MMMRDTDDSVRTFRATVRKLVADKVEPHAQSVDEEARFPEESYEALANAGILALAYPEKWGGQQADLLTQVVAVEEIAAACSTTALSVFATWAGLDAALVAGSPELLEEIVPGAVSGQTLVSFCLTEPRSGSDLAGLTTSAVRHGSDWVLNGTKRFITNGGRSDWYAVLARTGDQQYGVFMVDRDQEGVSFGALEKKMGHRGSPTSDVILDDVRVPAYRVVGDGTNGYRCMMNSLTYTRPIIAAQAIGIAQGALDASVRYIRERTAFGSSVADFQLVKGLVADMAVKVESSRAVLYRAIPLAEKNDESARGATSMAKLLATDTAMAVTTDAVQLLGGYGYLQDYPVERMMRDAKITQIYEGTNQIHRLLIAKQVYRDTPR